MAPLIPRIIFEDTHLLVIDKPAGLLSQGEHTGDENLVDWLRQYLGRPYVGLIHRLDRNTSGIMVVAKRTKSAQRLTDSLQAGKIDRTYLAWIEGKLTPGVSRWAHRLRKDPKRNVTEVVSARHPEGKEAILSVWPVAYGTGGGRELTLAGFRLETGRSHQIRVQASHEKHPLFGDSKYGGSSEFSRPALHSHRLKFEHPMSHKWIEFEAPLPPDMSRIKVTKRLAGESVVPNL